MPRKRSVTIPKLYLPNFSMRKPYLKLIGVMENKIDNSSSRTTRTRCFHYFLKTVNNKPLCRRGHLAENDPLPTTNSLRNVNNSFSIRKVSCFIEKSPQKIPRGNGIFALPWQPIMVFS